MSDNYIVYHCHSDYSNANGFADSCSKFDEYIKLAKKQNMKAIAFSEHGNIYDWIKKKQACDKAGIKYIHGVETYLCVNFQDDDRGGHIGLYAKNWDGVLELNRLVSKSSCKGVLDDKTDRHMYYNPRISLEELTSTSDNIIVTSACLASPLNRWDTDEKTSAFRSLIKWMTANKHRCFLEVQYHNCESQISFNRKLYAYSQKTGIPLIAGTDTHSSSEYKAECRKILQKYKNSFYGEEDEFDLTWKTYDELVEAFKNQGSLPEDVYMKAIQNTNLLADMVDNFELDKTFKYPTLYGDNVREQWKRLIYSCFDEKAKSNKLKLPSIIKARCDKFFDAHPVSPINESEKEIYETYLNDYKWANEHTDADIIAQYKKSIAEEFRIMCKLGMESFMMFMSELVMWANKNNIPCGTGRGSVCGSMIAFITNITDVDPMVWNTVFSRFCNEDRISLGDIDIDFAGEDRDKVYQYIIKRFTPEKTAYIAAFSTIKDRGCIDVLAGGLGYKDLDKVMDIKNKFDGYFSDYKKIVQEKVNTEELVENGETEDGNITFDNHNIYMSHIADDKSKKHLDSIKKQYDTLIKENQDLFYYLNGLKGTIVAKGTHPSGIIGSPITLADNVGLFYKDGKDDMPVSSCAMKAVDSLNYTKFDILGLKTVGIIKDACEYAGIPYPKSYELNWNDHNVWHNMIEAQQGVFQFEGDYAFSLLKDFKPNTINHMSMVNAALRPSGKSYRDRMIAGERNENPSKEIDDLLAGNNGFLIFQEDTIKFLTDICGFTGSAADTTRRAIGKKDKVLLQQQLPKILEGYCNNSPKERSIAEKEAKQFVQIIQDSSEYQFGYNHSTAYSMNGYECVWLRTYYPLEFIAAYLNRAKNDDDITYGVSLARQYGIEIKSIQFGKSLAKYTIDKESNFIYKGIESIKHCSSQIADELMELSKNDYTSFIDLLKDIDTKTSVNSRQLDILIRLNFFEQFGANKYLLDIVDIYNKFANAKIIAKKKMEKLGVSEYMMKKHSGKETASQWRELDNDGLIKELCSKLENKPLDIISQMDAELNFLGYVETVNEKMSSDYYAIVDFKTYKDSCKPSLVLRRICDGEEIAARVKHRNVYQRDPFGLLSILKIDNLAYEHKKKVGDEWVDSEEMECILREWTTIRS